MIGEGERGDRRRREGWSEKGRERERRTGAGGLKNKKQETIEGSVSFTDTVSGSSLTKLTVHVLCKILHDQPHEFCYHSTYCIKRGTRKCHSHS